MSETVPKLFRPKHVLRQCSHDAGTKKYRLISSPFRNVYTIAVNFRCDFNKCSHDAVCLKGRFTVRANASREMNNSFAGTESRFAFSCETSNMVVRSRKQIIIIMLLRRRLRRKTINKSTRNKRRFWVRQIYRERKQKGECLQVEKPFGRCDQRRSWKF